MPAPPAATSTRSWSSTTTTGTSSRPTTTPTGRSRATCLPVPEAGDYFVMVTGFLSLPEDPFDSGSGLGADAEGALRPGLAVGLIDLDFYGVKLRPATCSAARQGCSAADIVSTRPTASTGSARSRTRRSSTRSSRPSPVAETRDFAYVAEEAGWYAVSTEHRRRRLPDACSRSTGPARSPAGSGVTQKIFLDFDGERVNTAVFGGGGVSTLSPLSAFLGRWGLPSSQPRPLIDRDRRHREGEHQVRPRRAGLNDKRQDQDPEQSRQRGPVRQPERVARDRRRHDRSVRRLHDRHRAIDRPGQLRPRGDGAGAARHRERPRHRR